MKYIRYLLILLFPIIVSAKMSSIEVLDIKMEEKTGSVEIIEKETIMDSQIKFNLKFYDVGDTVKYKVKIKNTTGSDVGITVGESELKSKYLSYEAKLPDIKKLKNNEEVELTLNIRFYNNLEKEDIKSGKYIEEQKININLVDGKLLISNNEISDDLDDNTSNPLTSDYFIVYALIISFLLLIIITRNNKKLHKMIKKTTKYSLLLILLIPVFSSAVNGIKIKSYIEVRLVKPNPCTYDGDLINNARYEKEQYEYYYNEELNGWRLSLINRESTTPVTSKICTEINGKPLVSMHGTFSNSKAESIDLSSFDTSNTIYMDGMFYNLENIKSLDFITFDTTKVENMTNMLSGIKKIENIDLSGFETPNLVKMASMFANSNNIKKIDLSNFDTSHVTNMEGLFYNLVALEELNLSNWDFSKYNAPGLIPSIAGGASNIKKIILDNTKYGTTMVAAFSSLSNLEEISLKNIDTSKATTMANMFGGDQKIKELDLSDFDTSNVTNIEGMLGNMTSLEKVNLSNFDFRKASKSNLFVSVFGGTPKEKLKVINLSKSKYQGSLEYAFSNFAFVEEINMDNADVSNVTNMSNMFQNTSALTSLNMSKWDTSNVTDMNHMFYQASSIENIDVSDFNVEKVTNMDYMFSHMTKLKELNVTNFKTHSLKSLNDFASSNPRLTKLDLSSFDTSQLERMPWYLMYGDDNITEVNLSNWDMTSFDNNSHVMGRMLGGSSYSLAGGDYNIDYKVKKIIARNVKFPKDMYGMFAYIPTLEEIDLSNADTTRTTSMRDLFLGARKLKRIDLSSFDTSKVTNMSDMFTNTYALEEIDLSSFDISNVITASDMFQSTGATIGYAKNQEALEFFTSKAPSTLVFKIK